MIVKWTDWYKTWGFGRQKTIGISTRARTWKRMFFPTITQIPGESRNDRWKFCNTPSSCRPENTNAKSGRLRGLIRHLLAGLHALHLQHSVLHQVQQQPRHKVPGAPAIPDRSWYKGGLPAWVWGQLGSWGGWTSSILTLGSQIDYILQAPLASQFSTSYCWLALHKRFLVLRILNLFDINPKRTFLERVNLEN